MKHHHGNENNSFKIINTRIKLKLKAYIAQYQASILTKNFYSILFIIKCAYKLTF